MEKPIFPETAKPLFSIADRGISRGDSMTEAKALKGTARLEDLLVWTDGGGKEHQERR
jgi:hypothetical protein